MDTIDTDFTGTWAVIIRGKHMLTKKIRQCHGQNYTPEGDLVPLWEFEVVGDRFVYNDISYDVVEMVDKDTCQGKYYFAGYKLLSFKLKRLCEKNKKGMD